MKVPQHENVFCCGTCTCAPPPASETERDDLPLFGRADLDFEGDAEAEVILIAAACKGEGECALASRDDVGDTAETELAAPKLPELAGEPAAPAAATAANVASALAPAADVGLLCV